MAAVRESGGECRVVNACMHEQSRAVRGVASYHDVDPDLVVKGAGGLPVELEAAVVHHGLLDAVVDAIQAKRRHAHLGPHGRGRRLD